MKVHFVKAARKEHPGGIQVGDSYFWWKFRMGGKRYSKTYPRRSQLTQSDYYAQLWDLEDDFQPHLADSLDDAAAIFQETADAVRDILSEVEDSISNMESYEGLANSPTFELLERRRDALEELAQALEDKATDLEDFDLDQAVEELLAEQGHPGTFPSEDEFAEDLEEARKQEARANAIQTAIEDAMAEIDWTIE